MNIKRINGWFERFGRFQIRYRIWFITAVVVITAAGIAGLTKLKIVDDDSDWMDNAEVLKKSEDRYKALFGNENGIAVLVQAPDVFDPEVLAAIDKLGKRLLDVPYADRITSLTRLSISKGTDDGMEIVNPFEDGIPGGGKPASEMTDAEKAELAEKKAFIMSRTSLVNNLVSDDCTETWVFLSLFPFKDDFADQYIVGNAAIPIVESPEFQKNPKFTMKAAGMPYTETEENRVITHETIVRVVSGFIVMLLCLIFLVRSFRGVLVPLLAATLGIGTVLGYSGWFGIKGDSDLLTLPVLLGMALSVGYAIHYINSFKLEFRRTGNRKESVVASVRVTGWPILFTVLTTIASFVSFMGVGIG
ncbi:MAG: MMPL family transporter, partial [Treponema sp.]|nr:MMPL family transporter [Treponema sp.]